MCVSQGDNNWTPLHCSSFHGQVEIVEMLLSHGADESAKDLRGRTVAAVCEMAQYDVDEAREEESRSSYMTNIYVYYFHGRICSTRTINS